jgi:hypothetical protein
MFNLGDSFGFRRSAEFLFSGAEGRFSVPVSGSFLQGDLVEIDPASAGYVIKSATDKVLLPGVRGLLVQVDQLFIEPGLTRNVVFNTRDLSAVINDAPCVIATGAGLKVWVKNLASVTGTAGRRSYSAETRCSLTSLAVGDFVKWDGTKFVKGASAGVSVGVCTALQSAGFEFTLLA